MQRARINEQPRDGMVAGNSSRGRAKGGGAKDREAAPRICSGLVVADRARTQGACRNREGAAQILGISRRTIEFHRANIREKIGAKTTLDLLRAVLAAVDLS
jgi:hypothetical protein